MVVLTSNGLSSDKLILEMKKRINKNIKKAVIIVTADEIYKERNKNIPRLTRELKSLGLTVEYLDIDFQDLKLIENYDLVEFIGGNPYYLLNSLKKSKGKEILKEFAKNKIIIGCSAGSLVLQQSIKIIDIYSREMNDNVGLMDLKAIELVNIMILPHYHRFIDRYDFFEEKAKKYEDENNCYIHRIDDGEAIIVNKDEVEYINL